MLLHLDMVLQMGMCSAYRNTLSYAKWWMCYACIYTKVKYFRNLINLFVHIKLAVSKKQTKKQAAKQTPGQLGLHHYINQNFIMSLGQESCLVLDRK